MTHQQLKEKIEEKIDYISRHATHYTQASLEEALNKLAGTISRLVAEYVSGEMVGKNHTNMCVCRTHINLREGYDERISEEQQVRERVMKEFQIK